MDAVISFLYPLVTSYRAFVEIVSESSRIFSGESLQLRCSIPDAYMSTWSFLWFRGSNQLPQTGETIRLWNVKVKESGKFSCQGARETDMGTIKTKPSPPVEISVDGGWAILYAPPHPFLVGETMNLTCRLRVNRPVHETILYRNGVEVMRQNGSILHFYLTDATLEDSGMYSCRASWDVRRQTLSVISAATQVHVLEVLSEPMLEIVAESVNMRTDQMKLICHVQYNARAPAPPINYYFYKNNIRLGTATSENHDVVRRAPGWYSCRAKVPLLGLFRWSEAKPFGKVAEIQLPPRPHVRSYMPLAPAESPPEHILTAAAHVTRPQLSTETHAVKELTEDSTHSLVPH
ncbi:high affinity immunoglobulin epsilon receptor subunit alpha-like [Nematolebias whitei]|uniref:high affinity immunoglobulin epsilon receptor subunit alpha-like n=1 Tax=Nematolebias whitei TaxID=451745 RepID=UPI00189BE96F|nr:high affinity immunoglobulin epsilon receptor subunit alpha-like [Nematolebias whitei]